ncbi:hypothetical protein SRHO_G00307160 [Serrasalmus rhombeus]
MCPAPVPRALPSCQLLWLSSGPMGQPQGIWGSHEAGFNHWILLHQCRRTQKEPTAGEQQQSKPSPPHSTAYCSIATATQA